MFTGVVGSGFSSVVACRKAHHEFSWYSRNELSLGGGVMMLFSFGTFGSGGVTGCLPGCGVTASVRCEQNVQDDVVVVVELEASVATGIQTLRSSMDEAQRS